MVVVLGITQFGKNYVQAQSREEEMINKPLNLEEIEHFERELGYFNDIVVRCQECGRTQYLRLQYGIKNGWSECHETIMPIIYHKISELDKEEIQRVLILNVYQKMSYAPNQSEVF